MKTKILATLGAAAFAMGASVTASQAQIIPQPGETMGVALGAPLPEGVFFVDLESYGKRDGTPDHLGVNIPVIAWSTPFSFYDTRLEVLYAAPFTHIDSPVGTPGASGLNRVDSYSQALLFIAAHDFGNGFNAALVAGPRAPDNFTNLNRGVNADLRLALTYMKDGFAATATFTYAGNFGGKVAAGPVAGTTIGYTDNIYVDYTLTYTMNKVTFGIVGFAQEDIGGPPPAIVGNTHRRSVAVGGLLGYDFGKFTLQGMVTREVAGSGRAVDAAGNPIPGAAARVFGYGLPGGLETRGWLRLIVPLYVAPAAPVVKARY